LVCDGCTDNGGDYVVSVNSNTNSALVMVQPQR